jgi:biotin carboxyl carrier protein
MSVHQENEIFQSLAIDEVTYKTKLTKKFMMRKFYEPLNPKQILSFIPGTIQEIKVKVGDKVKIGDTLLVLDSMKMYNLMKAPQNGVIKNITVKLGEQIPKNFLIMEFV